MTIDQPNGPLESAQGTLPPQVTPAQLKQWIAEQQYRLDHGMPLSKQGIPPGYKVDGGKIVEQNWWDEWGKGAALTVGGGLAAGFGAAGLNGLLDGANSVSTLGGAGSYLDPSEFTLTSQAGLGGATVPSVTGAVNTATAAAAPSAASLPNWLKTAQDVGDALSKTSVGRAQGRLGEATANQNQNRAAVDLYDTQLRAPSIIGGNAVRGDILSNARDATISGISPNIPVPQISGGLRPSMFSDATRQAGTSISNNARDSAAALTVPKPPVLPELPQAGGLDEFLNTGSSVSNILGSVPKPAWDWLGKVFK